MLLSIYNKKIILLEKYNETSSLTIHKSI
jgi:hypothetical protein